MASTISQLSCFSSINRRQHLRPRSSPIPNFNPKVLIVKCHDGNGAEISNSESKTTVSYAADAVKSHDAILQKPYLDKEGSSNENLINESEPVVAEQKSAAKIHDFCFGIPFGGIVLSGGVFGFLFTRNISSLSNGVLFGGALLALSTFSLKIWRQGKSSFPFILGQAVLAASLLWKNIKTYSLTKKLFPTGFYAVISAAMLCFYTYVVLSGGNPPPKKLKSSATVGS